MGKINGEGSVLTLKNSLAVKWENGRLLSVVKIKKFQGENKEMTEKLAEISSLIPW